MHKLLSILSIASIANLSIAPFALANPTVNSVATPAVNAATQPVANRSIDAATNPVVVPPVVPPTSAAPLLNPVPPANPAPRRIPSLTPRPIAPIPQRPTDIVRRQDVRPLPGQLDNVPVFNSNSPEVIQREGILLSTFPADGMQTASAHLNFPFQGRFDIFAHHIARGVTPDDTRTLFVGILIFNPSTTPVKIDILQAVTYLSQDAPFNNLPAYVANPSGQVFAGPGSRTMSDVLRGQRQSQWPSEITIPPRHSYMLMNVPIPLRQLSVPTDGTLPPGYLIPPATPIRTAIASAAPVGIGAANAAEVPNSPPAAIAGDTRPLPINGRSALMQLSSSGPVYVASLSMYAPRTATGAERVPTLTEWERLLISGGLAGPRDRAPTSPNTRAYSRFFYGRVAGVARGSEWNATATDPNSNSLSIPNPGETFSYVISTVDRNTFGTQQIQSAPMLVRYPDTAYKAHGNYGVRYNVSLPLVNNTDGPQTIAIKLETPIQDESLDADGLRFRNPPEDQIFFRGTVRLRFVNDFGIPQTRDIHVIQRRGEEGEPLLRLTLPRGDRRNIQVQFLYPPDATPPQVITVRTLETSSLAGTNRP